MTRSNRNGNSVSPLVHTVLVGADREALQWIPRLLRDPQINLIGLVPSHPADLIHQLSDHDYALADPCPLTVFDNVAELAGLSDLDLIVDTTRDPGVVRALVEAGLDRLARVNSQALTTLLERPGPSTPMPSAAEITFNQRLAKEVGRAYRHGRCLGLLLIHLEADAGTGDAERLETAARVVEQSLRIEDVFAVREDGTIAVLLPETGEAVRTVAARLTSNLAALRIRSGTGGDAPHLSIGWAWFPQDAKTAPALMELAKAKMAPPPPTTG